ncbi:hypothetical protein [Pseudodesulfovibrio pelocollis]|uniref:hypothetical protein n=1 Tax=Pseudodesulfovibrio pelocollis TaxID=3051432 RepID=UPI00255AB2AA|nr:hypothetical protein [Pseudodesulfovibrio sp. SB368]
MTGPQFTFPVGKEVATQGNHTLMAAPPGRSMLDENSRLPVADNTAPAKTGYLAQEWIKQAQACGVPIVHLMPEDSESRKRNKGLDATLARSKDKGESQD